MHDVVIVGAGPAGLIAALYAARSKLDTKIIDKMIPGGQMLLTESIDNFPGFPGGIESNAFVQKMQEQIKDLDVEVDNAELKEIRKESNFVVESTDGQKLESKTVILATGAQYKKLGIPGEDRLAAKGVSYCAICDGPLFKNKDVMVIGGGNAAVEEALTLARFAKKVILIHRRDQLRAVKILQDKVLSNKKIEVIWDTVPIEFTGQQRLESVKVKNVKSNAESIVEVQGAFVSIGFIPNTNLFKSLVKLDEGGYIVTDNDMATSVEGMFACGDCRLKSLRQVVTACA
ncbi:thioredoxin-disulfide reductase, partial [Candidatus Omnitrophota bacterium]